MSRSLLANLAITTIKMVNYFIAKFKLKSIQVASYSSHMAEIYHLAEAKMDVRVHIANS